jgi:hypothetical protein
MRKLNIHRISHYQLPFASLEEILPDHKIDDFMIFEGRKHFTYQISHHCAKQRKLHNVLILALLMKC